MKPNLLKLAEHRCLLRFIAGFVICFVLVSTSFADVEEIDNSKLEALIAEGVAIVDVRRIDEWQANGLIEGVHTLTFFDKQGRYDAKKWLAALDEIAPKGTPVVLICEAGVRSKSIADLLDKRLGYTGVHNHTKGMRDWVKANKPTIQYKQHLGVESDNTAKSE